ncbi:MAG: type IV pilus assembly protein PilM [Candidatus Aerophobetes bacterium]|nr:type IV pilus assembly protein PilM [Candidatus Aerophobetes bacterium]
MAKVSVGLEIGGRAVKAVELIHRKKSYRLRKLGMVEIKPIEENSQSEALTIEALKKLISKYKINPKQIISGIGGDKVIVRIVEMPQMTDKELAQSIRWQVEEYIPYPSSEVSLGFHILDKDLPGEKMSVMLVGVKEEMIEAHLHLLQKAGISPQIIDVNALALFNAFQLFNPEELSNIALLDIGHYRTSIVLLIRGTPFVVRDINIGGFQITRSIAEQLKINYEEAEKIKKKYGFLTLQEIEREGEEKRGLVDRVIRKSMDNLVKETIHSFEYYTSQRGGEGINKLVLSGGSSCLKNIGGFLSEELEIPVEKYQPFEKITYDSRKFRAPYLVETGPMFTVALGLSLRKVKEV